METRDEGSGITSSEEAAKAWVSSGIIVPRKNINKNISSYGLKHIAERMQNVYIRNDDLIDAMVDAGYRPYQYVYMRLNGNPNYFFNFSWTQSKKWFMEHWGILL